MGINICGGNARAAQRVVQGQIGRGHAAGNGQGEHCIAAFGHGCIRPFHADAQIVIIRDGKRRVGPGCGEHSAARAGGGRAEFNADNLGRLAQRIAGDGEGDVLRQHRGRILRGGGKDECRGADAVIVHRSGRARRGHRHRNAHRAAGTARARAAQGHAEGNRCAIGLGAALVCANGVADGIAGCDVHRGGGRGNAAVSGGAAQPQGEGLRALIQVIGGNQHLDGLRRLPIARRESERRGIAGAVVAALNAAQLPGHRGICSGRGARQVDAEGDRISFIHLHAAGGVVAVHGGRVHRCGEAARRCRAHGNLHFGALFAHAAAALHCAACRADGGVLSESHPQHFRHALRHGVLGNLNAEGGAGIARRNRQAAARVVNVIAGGYIAADGVGNRHRRGGAIGGIVQANAEGDDIALARSGAAAHNGNADGVVIRQAGCGGSIRFRNRYRSAKGADGRNSDAEGLRLLVQSVVRRRQRKICKGGGHACYGSNLEHAARGREGAIHSHAAAAAGDGKIHHGRSAQFCAADGNAEHGGARRARAALCETVDVLPRNGGRAAFIIGNGNAGFFSHAGDAPAAAAHRAEGNFQLLRRFQQRIVCGADLDFETRLRRAEGEAAARCLCAESGLRNVVIPHSNSRAAHAEGHRDIFHRRCAAQRHRKGGRSPRLGNCARFSRFADNAHRNHIIIGNGQRAAALVGVGIRPRQHKERVAGAGKAQHQGAGSLRRGVLRGCDRNAVAAAGGDRQCQRRSEGAVIRAGCSSARREFLEIQHERAARRARAGEGKRQRGRFALFHLHISQTHRHRIADGNGSLRALGAAEGVGFRIAGILGNGAQGNGVKLLRLDGAVVVDGEREGLTGRVGGNGDAAGGIAAAAAAEILRCGVLVHGIRGGGHAVSHRDGHGRRGGYADREFGRGALCGSRRRCLGRNAEGGRGAHLQRNALQALQAAGIFGRHRNVCRARHKRRNGERTAHNARRCNSGIGRARGVAERIAVRIAERGRNIQRADRAAAHQRRDADCALRNRRAVSAHARADGPRRHAARNVDCAALPGFGVFAAHRRNGLQGDAELLVSVGEGVHEQGNAQHRIGGHGGGAQPARGKCRSRAIAKIGRSGRAEARHRPVQQQRAAALPAGHGNAEFGEIALCGGRGIGNADGDGIVIRQRGGGRGGDRAGCAGCAGLDGKRNAEFFGGLVQRIVRGRNGNGVRAAVAGGPHDIAADGREIRSRGGRCAAAANGPVHLGLCGKLHSGERCHVAQRAAVFGGAGGAGERQRARWHIAAGRNGEVGGKGSWLDENISGCVVRIE